MDAEGFLICLALGVVCGFIGFLVGGQCEYKRSIRQRQEHQHEAKQQRRWNEYLTALKGGRNEKK